MINEQTERRTAYLADRNKDRLTEAEQRFLDYSDIQEWPRDSRKDELQEIFTRVQRALREQGCASTRDFSCRYRGENGTKCAVGHLIPDEKYSEEMEGRGVYLLAAAYPDLLPWNVTLLHLLDDLQRAHDNDLGLNGFLAWEERMKDIAETHGLEY